MFCSDRCRIRHENSLRRIREDKARRERECVPDVNPSSPFLTREQTHALREQRAQIIAEIMGRKEM